MIQMWRNGRRLALCGLLSGGMWLAGCGQPASNTTAGATPEESKTPTVEAQPVVETKPAEPAPTPVVEPKPAEPTPVVETKPTEPAPAVETKPAEPVATVETKPTETEPTATTDAKTPPKVQAVMTFKEAPAKADPKVLEALSKRFKVPACVVHYTANPPAIDGKLDDKAWEGVEPVTTKFLNGDDGAIKFKTEIRCLHDGTYFYIAFVAYDKNMDNLADGSTTRDAPNWGADYVQFFIRPDHKTAENKYAGIAVFPGGGLTDHMGRNPEDEFNTQAEARVVKNKDNWTTEIKVPLTDVGAVPGKLNAVWRGNFFRVRVADGDNDGEDQGWSPTGEVTTHVHEKLGVLYFEGGQDLKDGE